MGRFSDYQVNEWLSGIGSFWMSLHYDNPETAGAYASEIFGGSYSRQACQLGTSDNRAVYVLNNVLFAGLPAMRITHIAGWDAEFNGNYILSDALENPISMALGKPLSIPGGTVALSMD